MSALYTIMSQLKWRTVIPSLVVCVGAMVTASAETIYENRAAYVGTFNNGGFELGNQITLGGTARYLNLFSFEYSLFPAPGANVQGIVRFYNNDGAQTTTSYSTPGTKFFESAPFAVTLGALGENRNVLNFVPGDGLPTMGIEMPSTPMTWTVEFQGVQAGDAVGLSLYTPSAEFAPQVFNDYWEQQAGVWTLHNNTTPPLFGTVFQASVTPVPEPSVALLTLPAALLFWVASRRNRASR